MPIQPLLLRILIPLISLAALGLFAACAAPPVPVSAPASDNPLKRSYLEKSVIEVPAAEIQRHLERNGRNAASLLAAFQASGDKAHLIEAAANFPGDPRVQLAVLQSDLFPDQRREWLERFKRSAPDNALAGYLSALDHFKNGDVAAAARDLAGASAQPLFRDYTIELMQDVEELRLGAGQSAVAAGIAAMQVPLPHLARLKQLGQEMTTLREHYLAAGDTASAEAMARMVLGLADRLTQGEGGRLLIDQMVGVAIERRLLDQLPPTDESDLLGVTPAQRIAELAAWKNSIKDAGAVLNLQLGQASEGELISYFDRLKASGELEAIRWLQAKPAQP
jgi:hypothetical protein